VEGPRHQKVSLLIPWEFLHDRSAKTINTAKEDKLWVSKYKAIIK
jgi:hypothetical protein